MNSSIRKFAISTIQENISDAERKILNHRQDISNWSSIEANLRVNGEDQLANSIIEEHIVWRSSSIGRHEKDIEVNKKQLKAIQSLPLHPSLDREDIF